MQTNDAQKGNLLRATTTVKIDSFFQTACMFSLRTDITGYLHFQNWDHEAWNRKIKRSFENYEVIAHSGKFPGVQMTFPSIIFSGIRRGAN